jgi:hypothetical protein
MTSTARTLGRVGGRLRLAVAGAAVLTALATGAATATGGTARSGASATAPAGPRSDTPVFVLDKGRFTAFDAPGQGAAEFQRINNRGQIAGFTADQFDATAEANAHGFVLRQGGGGPVTRIDVPGALGTGAMGINDRGQIVGVYLNPKAGPSRQATGTAPTGRMA